MNRILIISCVLILAVGCATMNEKEVLKPLPEDGTPVTYARMLERARKQATMATDAFQNDSWEEMDDAAKGLEQTARLMPKATDVPPKHKDQLTVETADLAKQAGQLREAVKAQNVKKTIDALQAINLKVREMRLDN
jgi:hypothetical protein